MIAVNKINEMMNLTNGVRLVCLTNPSKGVELNTPYTFIGYEKRNVPVNDYNATMTWYKSKPIWSPEEYEQICYNFMMVKLEGIAEPQWLKDFDLYEFTD